MHGVYLLILPVIITALIIPALTGLHNVETHSPATLITKCERLGSRQTITIDFLLDPKAHLSVSRERIQTWIETANSILMNSCLNIRRELGLVIETDSSHVDFLKRNDPKRLLRHLQKQEAKLYSFENHPHRIVVFVAPFRDENFVGYSWPTLYENFVFLTTDVMPYTLEHELGHLAGAQHEKPMIERFKNLIPFMSSKQSMNAATTCSGKQTIMSELTHIDNIVLTYSSPFTTLNGEACGHYQYANNRLVLEQYYRQFMTSLP